MLIFPFFFFFCPLKVNVLSVALISSVPLQRSYAQRKHCFGYTVTLFLMV